MEILRSPEGCPWDREQDHKSLIPFLLEETYEVIESINKNSIEDLKEELGDLLLQVVFHAQIAKESGEFNIDDVITGISTKLIRRHPNVFGNEKIDTAEEQSVNWEKLKKQEGKKSVVDGIPGTMPALSFAKRIQQRASTVGFDWQKTEEVWEKVVEEIAELKQEIKNQNQDKIEEEFGDLLFALVNYGRFLKIDPENSLKKATEKFIGRFKKLEKRIEDKSLSMEKLTLNELDREWNEIKKQ
ncbi:nucleoside triphosphate pyrophosphohydrolase [candidate division KSB1 bacterium]|nr:MAG: nucleoside triphosphate pyrophosphohydrolase [candidate division KSB1 bacterium]